MSAVQIGKYRLTSPLRGQNSGYARWGFAEYGGTEYFIKEFISPVYPDAASEISDEMRSAIIADCLDFEAGKSRLYRAVNASSNGNIIGVLDFFRFGSRYYAVTEKVEIDREGFGAASSLPFDKQVVLLKALLYNVKCIHDAGIIHADLKPDNLLIKRTQNGYFTAKLIDFDSSFFESEPPVNPDDFQGDAVYLAPETFLRISGEDVGVTRKADIFSLGIIFHELISGRRPSVPAGYDYIYEASLDGAGIMPDGRLPGGIRDLVRDMTGREPDRRPAAAEVFGRLAGMGLPAIKKIPGGFKRSAEFD